MWDKDWGIHLDRRANTTTIVTDSGARKWKLQAASYSRINNKTAALLYLIPRAIDGRQSGLEVALFRPCLRKVLLKLSLLSPPSPHVHGELVVLLLENGLRVGPSIIAL